MFSVSVTFKNFGLNNQHQIGPVSSFLIGLISEVRNFNVIGSMQVICLQNEAFYELIEQVILRIKEKQNLKQDKWISGEEAMRSEYFASPAKPRCRNAQRRKDSFLSTKAKNYPV